MNVAAGSKKRKELLQVEIVAPLSLGYIFFSLINLAFYFPVLLSLQTLFVLLGSACFIFVYLKMFPPGEDIDTTAYAVIVTAYLFLVSEYIRGSHPDSPFQLWTFTLIGLPAALAGGFGVFRLVFRYRKILGKLSFLVFLVMAVLLRNPNSGLFTFLFIIAQFPFAWVRKVQRKNLYVLSLASLVMLALYHYIVASTPSIDSYLSTKWSLMAVDLYSISFCLIRSCAWIIIASSIVMPFKPKRIRTRLRYAFLLNFLVPAVLIIAMSGVSLLFLVGGYQSATAKRLLFQIGDDAKNQAFLLWETARGIRHEPPPPSTFYRVGAVKFPDGSVQPFRYPPVELLEKMESVDTFDVEFIRVEDPQWELWIAGFYRHEDGSGATIAYRVDEDMLQYISSIIGLDLKLVSGFDWSFLPVTHSKEPKKVLRTHMFDSEKSHKDGSKGFPIGALLITRMQNPQVKDGDFAYLKPFATIEVIGARDSMAQALVKTGDLNNIKLSINAESGYKVEADSNISSAELQSMNILNFAVFVFLSFSAGILAGLIILSLFTSYLISRKINSALSLIKGGTSQLRKGNLDYRIPVITEDELGELAVDFNAMAMSLKNYQSEQKRLLVEKLEQDRLRKEFETARIIQRSLLPGSDPIHPCLEFAGTCQPAEEVGGDYFDYIELPEGAMGVAIGDVSGHGMSAGLLMSMAKSCLTNQIAVSTDIEDLIQSMNIMVCDSMKQKMIMTFLYAVFSADGSQFTFASAGHHFPYIYKTKTRELQEVESIAYPLGVRRNMQLQVKTVKLDPGDLVVFYTDGYVEAENPKNVQYGFERFEKLIDKYSKLPVSLIREKFLAELDRFRDKQDSLDDVTFVLIKVINPGQGKD